jgi:hypothetical protein
MKKQDILSIVMTFFVGVLAGSYLYIVGFAPTVATLAVPSQEKLDALVIESDVYGGCRDDCPSFQLLGDGSYRYLYTSDLSEPQSIADGKIPGALRRDLQRALTEEALLAQSQRINPTSCASFTDGIDVRYYVTRNGVDYTLDTCGTAVDTDSALWLNIKKIWDYLDVVSNQ